MVVPVSFSLSGGPLLLMLLLAIDTTSAHGGVSLAADDGIRDSKPIHAPDGFGTVIYQEIRSLLEKNSLHLHDVDCYAAAAGPGSFTGIRIGLAVVKSLAEAQGKMVVPVSNLAALAWAGSGHYRAPILDARRGEVYAAVYDDQLRPVVDEVVTPWEDFLRLVGDREVRFLSPDPTMFQPGGAAPIEAEGPACYRTATVSTCLAEAVAKVAARRFAEGQAVPPEAVDANYIRRPDAELKWKDPG